MSKTCPACGAPNKPGAKFCRGCGQGLAADGPVAGGAPGGGVGSGQQVCPNGHVYEGVSCPYCPKPGRAAHQRTMPEEDSGPAAGGPGGAGGAPFNIPKKRTVVDGAPKRAPRRGTIVDEEIVSRLVGWLVVMVSAEENSYKDFRIKDGKNIIGRRGGPNVDIAINDQRVSSQHAVLVHKEGRYRITDMGASNGTILNGQPCEMEVLNDGDRIKVGRTTLVFKPFQELAE